MTLFTNIRFVFLDRDGVINRKMPEGEYVSRWENFHIITGVEQAIASLNATGRKVFVVSNQRGIALGHYSQSDVELIHQKLQTHLKQFDAHIDAFYFCPHNTGDCNCRKPAPGLFLRAFQDYPDADPSHSVIIGDSVSDIEAGIRLGMRTIFLEGPSGTQKTGANLARKKADAIVQSLDQAVRLLMD